MNLERCKQHYRGGLRLFLGVISRILITFQAFALEGHRPIASQVLSKLSFARNNNPSHYVKYAASIYLIRNPSVVHEHLNDCSINNQNELTRMN
jgi:hypothetical protein